MGAFSVEFARSKGRRLGVVLLSAAMIVCVLLYFSGSLKGVLLAIVVLATVWAWHEPPLFVHRLLVDDDGFATIWVKNIAWEADLLSGCLITPWLCVLKWQTNQDVIWQAVLPDMLHREDYRLVLVWAKWGQPTRTQRKTRAIQRGDYSDDAA